MTSRLLRVTGLVTFMLLSTSGVLGGAKAPREQAWTILEANWNEHSVAKRVQAIRVLALLPRDAQAFELAKHAAADDKPEVRIAAATALGQMHGKASVALLRKLIDDEEPSVTLAAAVALVPSKDDAAYESYYEFLTGERKTSKGLIKTQMKMLRDPKRLAQIGIEEGIGFIPYASIGLEAFKALHTDDVSPVRAAAAKILASDPDPESGKALVVATWDKSWLVRAAALEAIAKRGDPALLDGIIPAMMDDNTAVRCTAAAAVIRLSTLSGATRRKTALRAKPDMPASARPAPATPLLSK